MSRTFVRGLRVASSGARLARSLPPAVAYRSQASGMTTIQQIRSAANKSGNGEKDDLGGPGGQEPVDPTQRAKQNASLRMKTMAAMILLGGPIWYMISKPDQVAGGHVENK